RCRLRSRIQILLPPPRPRHRHGRARVAVPGEEQHVRLDALAGRAPRHDLQQRAGRLHPWRVRRAAGGRTGDHARRRAAVHAAVGVAGEAVLTTGTARGLCRLAGAFLLALDLGLFLLILSIQETVQRTAPTSPSPSAPCAYRVRGARELIYLSERTCFILNE